MTMNFVSLAKTQDTLNAIAEVIYVIVYTVAKNHVPIAIEELFHDQ